MRSAIGASDGGTTSTKSFSPAWIFRKGFANPPPAIDIAALS